MTKPENPWVHKGAKIAVKWWEWMVDPNSPDRKKRNRAMVRMREAKTPVKVIYVADAHWLVGRFPNQCDRAAILAGVLACIRENDERRVGRIIGRPSLNEEEKALMKEGEFQTLLETQNDQIMDRMRNLVDLAKKKINVYDLSGAILDWGDGYRGNQVKKDGSTTTTERSTTTTMNRNHLGWNK